MPEAKQPKEFTDLDEETVEAIVRNMRSRESGQLIEPDDTTREFRNRIGATVNAYEGKMDPRHIEDLLEVNSIVVRKLVQIYLKLQDPLKPFSELISKVSVSQTLRYYLYSANMKFSFNQYIALTTSSGLLGALVGIVLGGIFAFLLRMPLPVYPVFSILFAILAGFTTVTVVLLLPQTVANSRGRAISLEMPYALRHMATEIKSGAGLYRTIQLIATADYGVLSEEFARTITEIEEGTDTTEALKHMASRVQSSSMRNAINHIVRAMKTGGNLSDVMNDIAQDVAIEIRLQISEFAEKLNFFGVIFIFLAIVLPVMVAILGGLVSAPLPISLSIPLTPPVLAVFYFFLMPLLMGFLIFYLRAIQPKV